MKYIIDRIEGDIAIIEDENKNMHEISKFLLADFKEGDVICISKCSEETQKRKDKIEKLAKELFN